MASIMGNPLASVAANIQDMQVARKACSDDIAELEAEKVVIQQAMGLVLDRLVSQNDKLGMLCQERSAFDRAIGEMSHAFDTILNTSKTLVSVAHREQEGIERQKRQMDLVSQGVSLEEQMEMARMEEERALGANGGGAEYSDEDDEYYGGGGGGGGGGEGGRPQLRDPRQQQAQQQQQQPRR